MSRARVWECEWACENLWPEAGVRTLEPVTGVPALRQRSLSSLSVNLARLSGVAASGDVLGSAHGRSVGADGGGTAGVTNDMLLWKECTERARKASRRGD